MAHATTKFKKGDKVLWLGQFPGVVQSGSWFKVYVVFQDEKGRNTGGGWHKPEELTLQKEASNGKN